MKKIICTNSEHARMENEIQKNFEKVKEVLNRFAALQLPFKINSCDELRSLLDNPEVYVKSRMAKEMDEPTPIFGVRFSREKTVEMLDLPNLDILKALCIEVQTHHLKHLTVSGNSVKLSTEALDNLLAESSVIITNDAQMAVYESHERLQSALLAFDESLVKLRGHGMIQGEKFKDAIRPFFFVNNGSLKIQHNIYLENRGKFKAIK